MDRGARQVHYVIDYYYNPLGAACAAPASAADAATAPVLTTGIHVDVRPAVQDIGTAIDRLLHFPRRAAEALRRPRFLAEGIDPSKVPAEELAKAACVSETEKKLNAEEDRAAAAAAAAAAKRPPLPSGGEGGGGGWSEVESRCEPILERLRSATLDADERRSTQVALNYCMGRALCPAEAGAFMRALEGSKASGAAGAAGGDEESAFGVMTQCVVAASRQRRLAEAGSSASSSSTALR